MGHGKIVCRKCGTGVSQCRCMEGHREVTYVDGCGYCPLPAATPAAPPALPVGLPTPRALALKILTTTRPGAVDTVIAIIEADRAAQARIREEAVAAARRDEQEACAQDVESFKVTPPFRGRHGEVMRFTVRALAGLLRKRRLAAPQPTDPTKGTDHGDL